MGSTNDSNPLTRNLALAEGEPEAAERPLTPRRARFHEADVGGAIHQRGGTGPANRSRDAGRGLAPPPGLPAPGSGGPQGQGGQVPPRWNAPYFAPGVQLALV